MTYETVRQWCLKFGQVYANELRRRRPHCGDKWHLDEVFLTIRGERHSLWRGVDQDGNVLDILVQSRRNKNAAKRFFRKLLKGLQYVPRVIMTDKLRSYGAAKREMLPGVQHRQHSRAQLSGGKFAPTDSTARKEDAKVQISQTGATLSFGLWSSLRAFPAATSPLECRRISCYFAGTLPAME